MLRVSVSILLSVTSKVSPGHGTLADRVAGRSPGIRLPSHVWVSVGGVRYPGILLEWLRGEDGWMARIVWASTASAVHLEVFPGDAIAPLSRPR